VAQVVREELDQNEPKEEDKHRQRIAIWSRSTREVIRGMKAPLQKHLQTFLGAQALALPCHASQATSRF
jgi:hypothetical protein